MAKKKKAPTLRSLKKSLWRLFSEYVRRKDADEGGTTNCFTCGRLAHWKDLQCGHAIAGRSHAVLFDDEVCRPQCYRCNVGFRGNYAVFTTKLIQERSVGWFEEKLIEARKVVKFTRPDLEAMILDIKQKLAALSG